VTANTSRTDIIVGIYNMFKLMNKNYKITLNKVYFK
jgi:hypothetical protein